METTTTTSQPVQENQARKIPKPNNLFNVNCATSIEFFRWWCVFLRPFVPLTERETDVIASFLKQRYELSKSISDPAILDTMVMSDETKNKVITECNITLQHFYVVMSTLRKKGVIKGSIINPKLIPNMRTDDNGTFRLLIQFKENA